MKKTVKTILILSTALIITGILFVNLVMANPNPDFPYYPQTPITTSPIININSPIQNNTTLDSITLNFTIIKPTSWFGYIPNQFRLETQNITIYYSIVRIRSFYYLLDNQKSQTFPINDSSGEIKVPSENFSFCKNLDVTEGNHNLTIYVNCQSYYYPINSKVWDNASNINYTDTSKTVNFTVTKSNLQPQSEPFPIMPVTASISIVAIVSVSLLIYFKKHKERK